MADYRVSCRDGTNVIDSSADAEAALEWTSPRIRTRWRQSPQGTRVYPDCGLRVRRRDSAEQRSHRETVMHMNPILPADLGQKRTVMAADRTLMAWIRTSLSMLSFGFTIYKFLDALADSHQIANSSSPRHIGMFLVGMGTLTMVMGTIGYWTTLWDLQRLEKFRLGRPVLFIAILMSLAGSGLFLTITTRMV
jgi:putative membrane protein